MLKYLLLATTMTIASPALAQEVPDTGQTPATQETTPADPVTPGDSTDTPVMTPDSAAPTAQTGPTTSQVPQQPVPAQQAQTSPAPAQTAPAQQAQSTPEPAAPAEPAAQQAQQPAASQDQVAQAVGREFGSYDKDANGGLDKTEFSAWMTALRKASEPTFQPGSPEAATWMAQAFTLADADKSASINQGELTTFLTPKPS